MLTYLYFINLAGNSKLQCILQIVSKMTQVGYTKHVLGHWSSVKI